jgi:predicted MFS family arabinose efflux permease
MIEYTPLILLKNSSVARRMLIFLALSGVVFSMMQFGEVIARKSLGASTFEVTLLTMVMPVTLLTSIWWGRLLIGRDQRAVLWLSAVLGTAALASGLWLESVKHLFLIFIVLFLTLALQGTARNRVFQQYIASNETGGFFGVAQGLRMAFAAILAAAGGWWMDRVTEGWKPLFLLVALVGFISVAAMASIRTGQGSTDSIQECENWLTGPWRNVIRLLKRRPDFLRFEAAFMVYGIAFMMTLPVVPIFLVDDLELSYATIGLAKGAIFSLVMIITVPLFGRLFDRSTPHRLAVAMFALLSLYPATLLLAKYSAHTLRMVMLYLAFAIFGVAMSGVMLIWNLASMRFSGQQEDAGLYQSVHLAATGVRGLFAPLIGYLVMQSLGMSTALLATSGLWLVAAAAMIIARTVDRKTGAIRSLRA